MAPKNINKPKHRKDNILKWTRKETGRELAHNSGQWRDLEKTVISEKRYLHACEAVQSGVSLPTFRRNV